MLRMLGRRSVRRSVRRGRREREVRSLRVRRGEMSTVPPDKLTKHLLPCHVRLLDGTDLYCQLPVSQNHILHFSIINHVERVICSPLW